MFRKRLAALVALVALGVAACSGGNNVTTSPIPAATAAGTGLSSSGAAIAASGASGITSSITVAGTGSVIAASSTTAPVGVPALSALARKEGESLKIAATVPNTALVYITLTASVATTITGFPASSFTFGTAPTGSVYLGATTGGTASYSTIAGPGTLSGTTITFAAVTPGTPITLAQGASLFLVVYTGGVITSPTPAPTATPTPTATASARPTASAGASATPVGTGTNVVVNGNFEGATTTSTFFAASFGVPSPTPAVVPSGWFICQNQSELQTAPAAIASPGFVAMVQQINTANQTNLVPSIENLTGGPYHGGSGAVMLGNVNASASPVPAAPGGTKGGFGICQDVVVPAGGQLTFWVNEGTGGTSGATTTPVSGTNVFVNPIPVTGGSTFTTGSAQEAAVLDPTTHTLKSTGVYLFDELNGLQTNTPSFLQPASNSPSSTSIGYQTGYVQKGPYDLSAYAGTTVELYFGIWRNSAATTAFTFMFVDDVSLVGR